MRTSPLDQSSAGKEAGAPTESPPRLAVGAGSHPGGKSAADEKSALGIGRSYDCGSRKRIGWKDKNFYMF
jgi:hypothetical protein